MVSLVLFSPVTFYLMIQGDAVVKILGAHLLLSRLRNSPKGPGRYEHKILRATARARGFSAAPIDVAAIVLNSLCLYWKSSDRKGAAKLRRWSTLHL